MHDHVVTAAAVGTGDKLGLQVRLVERIAHAPHTQQSLRTALARQFRLQVHIGALHSLPLLIRGEHASVINLVGEQNTGHQLRLRVRVAILILASCDSFGPEEIGGCRAPAEQGVHALDNTEVGTAVVHETSLAAGRNLVADVQVEKQRPEMLAVQQVSQRSGALVQRFGLAIALQHGQLQGAAQQGGIQLQVAGAQGIIMAGKAGAVLINQHIHTIFRRHHIEIGEEAEMPLAGNRHIEITVAPHTRALSQGIQHQR